MVAVTICVSYSGVYSVLYLVFYAAFSTSMNNPAIWNYLFVYEHFAVMLYSDFYSILFVLRCSLFHVDQQLYHLQQRRHVHSMFCRLCIDSGKHQVCRYVTITSLINNNHIVDTDFTHRKHLQINKKQKTWMQVEKYG